MRPSRSPPEYSSSPSRITVRLSGSVPASDQLSSTSSPGSTIAGLAAKRATVGGVAGRTITETLPLTSPPGPAALSVNVVSASRGALSTAPAATERSTVA